MPPQSFLSQSIMMAKNECQLSFHLNGRVHWLRASDTESILLAAKALGLMGATDLEPLQLTPTMAKLEVPK